MDNMTESLTELLTKISSYNIFNNLVPGVVFSYMMDLVGIYTVSTGSLLTNLFVFYFIGVVISRVGSIFIEPVLKSVRIVKYSDYSSYLSAYDKDHKIPVLVEENNQYRTYISMLFMVVSAIAVKWAMERYSVPAASVKFVIIGVLLVMFVLAYRKQTSFIRRRVERHTK